MWQQTASWLGCSWDLASHWLSRLTLLCGHWTWHCESTSLVKMVTTLCTLARGFLLDANAAPGVARAVLLVGGLWHAFDISFCFSIWIPQLDTLTLRRWRIFCKSMRCTTRSCKLRKLTRCRCVNRKYQVTSLLTWQDLRRQREGSAEYDQAMWQQCVNSTNIGMVNEWFNLVEHQDQLEVTDDLFPNRGSDVGTMNLHKILSKVQNQIPSPVPCTSSTCIKVYEDTEQKVLKKSKIVYLGLIQAVKGGSSVHLYQIYHDQNGRSRVLGLKTQTSRSFEQFASCTKNHHVFVCNVSRCTQRDRWECADQRQERSTTRQDMLPRQLANMSACLKPIGVVISVCLITLNDS